MPFREPGWWYRPEPGLAARVLLPAAYVMGVAAERRMARAPEMASPMPVLCIGNFTAGGTGKTPLALFIAARLTALGRKPAFLTRGYGSRVRTPTLVERDRHTAADVGDEALLLTAAAPVMVSPDRAAGARSLAEAGLGVDVIVMDDGLQNPALGKDLTIAVVDGRRGFGNGCVIPAGPLRAPLPAQLHQTDVVVVNGRIEDRATIQGELAPAFSGPVLSACAQPVMDTDWLSGTRVVAFAGIGNPERFFGLLERAGAHVVAARRFADHHPFSDAEAAALLAEAARLNARIVTTEKDYVRLGTSEAQTGVAGGGADGADYAYFRQR